MAEDKKQNNAGFILTPSVVTSLDIGRAIREAEKLDDFLYQSKIRSPGSQQPMPKVTRMLEGLAEANGLSLLNATHRKHLIGNLEKIKTSGKKIHISFAVEPAPAVMQKIVIWLRENIAADLIINVGVQPTISVGCVVRTTNKVFDMSLRHRFADSKKMLAEIVEKTK